MPTLAEVLAARQAGAPRLGQFYGGGIPVQRPMAPPQGMVPPQRPMLPPQGIPMQRPGMARPMPVQAQGAPRFGPGMGQGAPISPRPVAPPTAAAGPGLAGLTGRPNIGRFYG